jgi:hypothetical protein
VTIVTRDIKRQPPHPELSRGLDRPYDANSQLLQRHDPPRNAQPKFEVKTDAQPEKFVFELNDLQQNFKVLTICQTFVDAAHSVV